MSLEVLLVPLGMMAIAAIKEAREADAVQEQRMLRITDRDLLARSLDSLGTRYLRSDTGDVAIDRPEGPVIISSDAGVLVARAAAPSQGLTDFVDAVEAAAGRIRQADSVEQMRLRAAQLGLRIIGEQVSADGTVELVFEEVGS